MSEPDIDDPIVAKVSDYLDGLIAGTERDEVAKKIETDEAWKSAHTELLETRKFLSGMRKARAPDSFAQDVTATIHKRSAGRFFARRTFGDRVPFGALMIFAVLGLAVLGYFLWASQTGSLGPNRHRDGSEQHGTERVVSPP